MCRDLECKRARLRRCKRGYLHFVSQIIQSQTWHLNTKTGCNLPHDRGLSHAKTGNESARIDCAKVAVDASDHEDDDADYPENTEEPSGHDTANAITHKEGTMNLNISQRQSLNPLGM